MAFMSENINLYWDYVTTRYPDAQFDFFYRSGELHFWPDKESKDAGNSVWGCVRKGEDLAIVTGEETHTKGAPKRLTHWNGKKWILPQGAWREIADRLAAYENTGLEPEDILKLKGE